MWFLLSLQAVESRTYRLLAVRVDFPYEDPDHDTTSGQGKFDLSDYYDETETVLQEQYRNPWDVPPHDLRYFDNHLTALRNYWRTVSEDRIDIVWDIYPRANDAAYTLSNKFYKYGNGRTKEETYAKLVGLLDEALLACKDAEGSNVDFSAYDTFMIIHAGIGSETSGNLNDIPSAFITKKDIEAYLDTPLVIDGHAVDNGIVVPEMTAANGYGGLNGILAQMFGYRLGLPSLSNNEDGLPAAGGWCLMDTGAMSFGHATRGFIPTHPCAWSKTDLGWIDPVTVTSDTTLHIAATHIDNGLPRALKIPISGDEYLLIENRIRYAPRDSLPGVTFSDSDSSGVWLSVDHYDAYIPGSGILVWRINDAIIREKRADNTINDDRYRRGVDLLEADGREDIGALIGFGDSRGEYTEGHDDDTLKKGGTTSLGPNSKPDTGSMWGGRSGITVRTESEPGDVMSVTITFTGPLPGFPVALNGTGRLTALDFDSDGAEELIVSDDDGWKFVSSTGAVSSPIPYHTSHPAAVRQADGSRSLVSIDTGNGSRITVLKRDGSINTINYEIPGYELAAFLGYPVAAGGTANHEGILLYATMNRLSGAPAGLLVYSDDISAGQPYTVTLPDTVSLKGMTAVYPRISLLGSGTTIINLTLDDATPTTAVLDAESSWGPVMADFDRDDEYETAVVTSRGIVYYETDGSVRTAHISSPPVNEPAVADIDNDGYPDVVVSTSKEIYAFSRDGIPLNGFPFKMPPGDTDERFISAPVIADLDDDGMLDIAICTSNSRMISYRVNGQPTRGFPLAIRGVVTGSPCLFRLDSSGALALAYITENNELMAHDLGTKAENEHLPWPMWKGGPGLVSAFLNKDISSGVRTTADFEAYCYPNPITAGVGTFRVTPPSATNLTITLYTADGIKVFERKLTRSEIVPGVPNEVAFDVSRLASGLYIARIETDLKTVLYKVGVLR